MARGRIARVSITVTASRDNVWGSLVNPEAVKHCTFGTQVTSDWHEGSPIT